MADPRQNGPDDLDRRIAEAKADASRPTPIRGEGAAENRGWAVGIEFVGSMLVGGLIGFFVDRWLGTTPWLMIVFLVLGFVAGLRRTIIMSKKFDANLSDDR